MEAERRLSLRSLLSVAAKTLAEVNEVRESVSREITRIIEEALDIPLTEERLLLRLLYSFPGSRDPDPEELRRLIERYMGLEEGVNVIDYIKGLGRRGTRPNGERG